MKLDFNGYDNGGFFDEFFDDTGKPRPAAELLIQRINELPSRDLECRQAAAEKMLLNLGITFTVYSDKSGTERIFPFDLIPRIVNAADWLHMETGLKQRVRALNAFIDDIYHDQRILAEKVIPADLILGADSYRKQCHGLNPPNGIWCHITGTDLIRHADGTFYVLEDNLRCPSGVSYVLQNREVMKRSFPQVFEASQIRPVVNYPTRLRQTLQSLIPPAATHPTLAVLTPGVYNSAYFEHSFLAQQMGAQLVEGRDLIIQDGYVHMRTTTGLQRIDVIYRRIDDDFIDPMVFRPDSMLGVPGLMEAYRGGRVALANAPGTGVADDKAVYAYVPDMIRFYLSEEPILANVPTYLAWRDEDRSYILDHLNELVVKAANESGGYGMLVGPHSTLAQQKDFAERIKTNPRNYIAQPTLALSRVPTIADGAIEGRHVDLRPYVLYGRDGIDVMPGGLTRVALRKGSLVVNSSQGGGSKDTWVIEDDVSAVAAAKVEGGASC